ncbi:MAG: hypothetical protein WCK02_16990 [Bacteroidota bacterium]
MKQVVLNIPDNKFNFFMELIRNIKFVKIEKSKESNLVKEDDVDYSPSKEETIETIKRGFEEMQLIKQGKLKTTSLKDFLNEL